MVPRAAAEPKEVIVVGAGPVGLVAALLLSEAGIPVILLEAEDDVSDDLRASTFHPPTLDMLAPYGVTDALLAEGLACPEWQIRMHATGERAVFDMTVIDDLTDHPYRLQCEQARLCRHLSRRLAESSLVDLRFGERVTGLQQDAESVTLELETARGTATRTARYVIAADGASSSIRELLGLDFAGITYPETTVLASTPFPFESHIEGLSNVSYCWSDRGNFSLLRLKDFWRCSLYYDPGLTVEQAVEPERIQAQLREILPQVNHFEIIDRRPYRVHQRIVENYRHGRVLLAGDAAHVNSPSGGMGMNGGIHDAFNLAEKLTAVWQGASDSLLDLYSRQRRPVAEQEILQQADRNRRRMTERDPEKRRAHLRDLQETAKDPQKAHAFLYRSSMFAGLQRAESIQ